MSKEIKVSELQMNTYIQAMQEMMAIIDEGIDPEAVDLEVYENLVKEMEALILGAEDASESTDDKDPVEAKKADAGKEKPAPAVVDA